MEAAALAVEAALEVVLAVVEILAEVAPVAAGSGTDSASMESTQNNDG